MVTYLLTARAIADKLTVRLPPPGPVSGGPLAGGAQDPAGLGESLVVIRQEVTAQLTAQRHAVMSQLLQSSIMTVLGLGLLAIVLGYVVAGRLLRPLQTV